jgi:hypothetical protein
MAVVPAVVAVAAAAAHHTQREPIEGLLLLG